MCISPSRHFFRVCAVPGCIAEHCLLGTGAQTRLGVLQAGEELLAVVGVREAIVVAETEDSE